MDSGTCTKEVVLMCLALRWCGRPNTLVSCRRVNVSFVDDALWLVPDSHKRKPAAFTFKVKFPKSWVNFIKGYLACIPPAWAYLFGE